MSSRSAQKAFAFRAKDAKRGTEDTLRRPGRLPSAQFARTDAKFAAKRPVERGEVAEAPGVGNVGDGPGSARWAFQYRATFFEPPALHMLRKAGPRWLEQEMQLSNRDL